MKRLISYIFGSFYKSLGGFAIVMIAGYLTLSFYGVGALTIPVDRARGLRAESGNPSALENEVGVFFMVKDAFTATDAGVALEVKEISAAKVLTGVGSVEPMRSGGSPLVQSRYARIDGIKLPKLTRGDYLVYGKASGGKVEGSVSVGGEPVSRAVFLTRIEFYFICAMFSITGIIVGWTIRFISVGKKRAAREMVKAVVAAKA